MKQEHDELQRRLSTLRSSFADTAGRAAAAAVAMGTTVAPDERLIDDLRAAGRAFGELRDALLEHAAPLAPRPDAASLASLSDLESLLHALIEAEERRRKQLAWEHARESARAVLDRVLTLLHREHAAFAPLSACQAKALELHVTLEQEPQDVEQETTLVHGRIRPFTELLSLVDGWSALDDDRCALLQDSVTRSFGRQLGLAALRGKLVFEGQWSAPAPEPVRPVRAAAPDDDVEALPVAAEAPTAPSITIPPPVPPAIPVVAAPPPSPAPPRAPVVAPPPPLRMTTPSSSSGLVLDRHAGEAESAEARREREAQLEQLAAERATWWIGARHGWTTMRERGLSFADAVTETLTRFPHVLSVPIQRSAEHEHGRLAEGYALLLEHIERQEEGFVGEALSRLNPEFTTAAADRSEYPLGQELYLYVVAEGRLYKTYPDFLKEVMARAVPQPGFWVQGGITEGATETTVFTRPDTPGAGAAESTPLTDPTARFTTHVFGVDLGPLTSRFFTVEADELPDPTDVDITLKDNDAASDRAWIVSVPATAKPEPPKKHKASGTSVPELGRQYRAIWIGVFNADPNHDKRYELAITLKRRTPPAAAGATKFAAPKASPFAPKKKG